MPGIATLGKLFFKKTFKGSEEAAFVEKSSPRPRLQAWH
jgi:hypothetical protein